jgi:hypothetical protein
MKCKHKRKLYSQSVVQPKHWWNKPSIGWGWRCAKCGFDYLPR